MGNERKYFDANKLVHKIYTKIAMWHNNEERLSDIELGRELKFLSKEISEDVIRAVFDGESVKVDTDRMDVDEVEMARLEREREERRVALKTKVEEANAEGHPSSPSETA